MTATLPPDSARLEALASIYETLAGFFDKMAMIDPESANSASRNRETAASLRALIAAREVLAEMHADDAINEAEIERARRDGPRHYVSELIGAKRDTRVWAKKLTAILGGKDPT